MADKTNTPPSMAAMLARYRSSGPATVYDMAEDGTIAAVRTRPARPPWQAGRLNARQVLTLLRETGRMPETLAPEARVGMQPGDMDNPDSGRRMSLIRAQLTVAGLMHGWSEGEGYSN